MRSATAQAPDARKTAALLSLTIVPVVAFVLARYLGLMSLVRLAALGGAALGVGLVFLLRPKYGIYFMLFYIYSGLNFYIRLGPGTILPKLTMLVIFTGAVVEIMRGRAWQPIDRAFAWSVSFFGILALQSMLWAHSIPHAVVNFSIFLKSLVLVLLIVQLLRTPGDLKWFGRWIFVGAVATIGLGLANWMLGIDEEINVLHMRFMRFTGAHQDPNLAAAFMTSAVPMGVFAIRSAKTLLWRVLSVLGVVMLIIGVFTTYSRAALFAFAFVVLGVLFKEVRSRKAYAAILSVLVVGILLTPRFYWARIVTLAEIAETIREDWSLYLRTEALGTAWEMFKEHPFAGVGLKNFSVRSSPAMFVRIVTHNSYLDILCGVGLFGLIAYLSVFYSGLRNCVAGVRTSWAKQDEWLRVFSYYLMLSFTSALVSGIFVSAEFNYMIWVPLGGALVLANSIKSSARDLSPSPAGDGVDVT